MGLKASSNNEVVPEQIWTLLEQYVSLLTRYQRGKAEIWIKLAAECLEKQGISDRVALLEGTYLLRGIDEFVDNLITYFSYYRNQRRSLHTLFSSVGITDPQVFAEMVRKASDPRPAIRNKELDIDGIKWFLGQFQEDYQIVEKDQRKLISYLPHLENLYTVMQSDFLEKFLEVLRYVTSDEAKQLQLKGFTAIAAVLKEKNLDKAINLVAVAITAFGKFALDHPKFILTDSLGIFDEKALEKFDQKIQEFEKIRQKFKEHVSLHDRTRWIFEEHHNLLFRSIFKLPPMEIDEMMHKIGGGMDLRKMTSHLNDFNMMLLGISQSLSLFLEFRAYQDQMINLVGSYKQLAGFLNSELLEILYETEVQHNKLYLKFRKGFQAVLDQFQGTLLKITSVSPENAEANGSTQ